MWCFWPLGGGIGFFLLRSEKELTAAPVGAGCLMITLC